MRWSAEWSGRLPIPEQTIRAYLTTNIHYILDEECIEGMSSFLPHGRAIRRPPRIHSRHLRVGRLEKNCD